MLNVNDQHSIEAVADPGIAGGVPSLFPTTDVCYTERYTSTMYYIRCTADD